MSVAVIVLAGGSGSRARDDLNKVYAPVRGRSLLEYALETMELSPRVGRVVLVIREEDRDRAEQIVEDVMKSKPTRVVTGGLTRHLSEMAGLSALRADIERGTVDFVAIHDGARPFVTLELMDQLIDAMDEHGGAVPGLAIPEPLYRIDGERVELLPPDSLRRVQTPQVFEARDLLAAYETSIELGFEGVDTAETIERFSDLTVTVVPGDARNIKVTFAEDLGLAEEYAGEWDKGAWIER